MQRPYRPRWRLQGATTLTALKRLAGFATVAMMNAVSPTAIGMDEKVAAATVQVLDGRVDPGAGSSGASLRDRALRSYRRCASIPLRSLAPPHAARAAR